MDTISVILCAYNSEHSVEKCINSILNNKCVDDKYQFNLQLVVVNDGSTDGTESIVSRYTDTDSRITYVYQENKGVSSARFTAMNYVVGDYVAFCDADDWVDDDWLISMYHYIKEYNADIVRFRAMIEMGGAGNLIKQSRRNIEVLEWNRDEALREFFIHKRINAMLLMELSSIKIWNKVKFRTDIRTYEDLAVAIPKLMNARKVVRVDMAKYHYFVNPEGISNGALKLDSVRDIITIFEDMLKRCESLNQEFVLSAKALQARWLVSSLARMYKEQKYDKVIESYIQKTIRRYPFISITGQYGFKNKCFALSAITSLPVTKLLSSIIRK